ncbi:MAG: pirin family protein [Candidatus Margulisiibacteriota bacterium]
MNIDIIKAQDRGRTHIEWLDSWHTFSFGGYYNPKRIHFGAIRVINDDIIDPGQGFDLHPHDNMEIVTIVLSGELEHKDSLGNGGILKPGDVQAMSAGTGLYHSERNPSRTTPVHLLQIWVMPNQKNLTPRYQDSQFAWTPNGWTQVVGSEPSEDRLWIHQNCRFYLGQFEAGTRVVLPAGNAHLVMPIEGEIKLDYVVLAEADTALVKEAGDTQLEALKPSRVLVMVQ